MVRKNKKSDDAAELRRKAEKTAQENEGRSLKKTDALSSEETRLMLHELRVHQIELEMQNEELRHAQVELDGVRERYFDLYDLAPVGYCTLNENGLILEANIAASTLTGMARGALINQPFTRFILKEDQDLYYRHRKQLLETGGSLAQELRMINKSGNHFWVLLETTVVRDGKSGKPVYRIIISDISGLKRVEEEKRVLEDQLRQSQKIEAIGRLAGGVAHDFNNMLNVILGYGEMVLGKLEHGDPLRDDMVEIIKAGERSAALTRQLLAFSRKQMLQPELVDLNALSRNLEKMLRRMIGEDIDLCFVLADDLGCVWADPGQVELVLINLVVNSKDAMPQGGKLTIETANVEFEGPYAQTDADVAPGKYAMITVTDTGCGMDETTQSRAFEPFFSTKSKDKGTGLGLSTAYGILKQSGGNIFVRSEPGKGATFTILLPRVDGKPKIADITKATRSLQGDGKSIFVVEDEDVLRGLIEAILKEYGYNVIVARNGCEALALAEVNGLKSDLVLSDVIMPNMNGTVVVERLRRIRPDVKVLFMSGYTGDSVELHGVIDPKMPFIQKPFYMKDLVAKIELVLGS